MAFDSNPSLSFDITYDRKKKRYGAFEKARRDDDSMRMTIAKKGQQIKGKRTSVVPRTWFMTGKEKKQDVCMVKGTNGLQRCWFVSGS
jgi:hypothetical protein